MYRHLYGYYVNPYVPIVHTLYVFGVADVPGAVLFVPSSSDELCQWQGLDSADLQEEPWAQSTARNSSRLGRLRFSHRT